MIITSKIMSNMKIKKKHLVSHIILPCSSNYLLIKCSLEEKIREKKNDPTLC